NRLRAAERLRGVDDDLAHAAHAGLPWRARRHSLGVLLEVVAELRDLAVNGADGRTAGILAGENAAVGAAAAGSRRAPLAGCGGVGSSRRRRPALPRLASARGNAAPGCSARAEVASVGTVVV